MANEKDFFTVSIGEPNGYDLYEEVEGHSSSAGSSKVGRLEWFDSSYPKTKGAFRMRNVQIPKNATLNSANLAMFRQGNRSGSLPIYFKIWGIKEPNTNDFSSYPMARTKTTAFVTGQIDSESIKQIGVKDIVEEIVAQSSWAPGNAIGFIIEDNGTASGSGDQNIYFYFGILSTREVAEPNFTPTPKSVAAPTFPAPYNLGVRFVTPGFHALDSPDTPEITQFSTKRRPDFIKLEGPLTTTAGVTHLIPHELNFKPRAEMSVMASGGTQRFRAPRVVPPLQSGADIVNGEINSDETYIRIKTSVNADVYYRIFLDKIDPS